MIPETTRPAVGAYDWTLGPHPDAHHLLLESMLGLGWDGETGYGYMERSVCTR